MPANNILLFDQNKGNIMGDTEYNTNQQRLNGVQSGIASSQLQNKFQYQVSLVAYAIASLMYNNGLDANDADAVSAFVSNLSGTLVQKVLDKASTSEAQAGTVDTKWMSPALVKAAIDFTLTNPLTISGNTTFTGTVSGPTPTLDSHLTPKSYVDQSINERITIKTIFDTTVNFNNTASGANVVNKLITNLQYNLFNNNFSNLILEIDYNITLSIAGGVAFLSLSSIQLSNYGTGAVINRMNTGNYSMNGKVSYNIAQTNIGAKDNIELYLLAYLGQTDEGYMGITNFLEKRPSPLYFSFTCSGSATINGNIGVRMIQPIYG